MNRVYLFLASVVLFAVMGVDAPVSLSVNAALAEGDQVNTVENEHLLLQLDTSHGLTVTRLVDKVTGHEYFAASRPTSNSSLFFFRTSLVSNTFYTSYSDLDIQQVTSSEDRHRLTITAQAKDMPLRFSLSVQLDPNQPIVVLHFSVWNDTSEAVSIQLDYPRVQNVDLPSDTIGALPIEIGAVGPLARRPTFEAGDVDRSVGLSHALNLMELADIYASAGGGVFFADLDDGAAPIQFSLSAHDLIGHWSGTLPPNSEAALPRLGIGVHHEGDWHAAVDYYISQHQGDFVNTPAWLREAGALYAYGGEGGGGILQQQATITLKERIGSFENLPQLLEEAQALGTNIVYLYDYWEGTTEGGRPPYWNKGDYVPRTDMGGAEAFKNGIAEIHAGGGRVLLYLEPFIVFRYSELGRSVGERWAGRDLSGSLYSQYPDNYTMCPTSEVWADYITSVAQRLVQDYGADGIYLDSFGWQWNWACQNQEENQPVSAEGWNQGVLDLTDRIRSAIQQIDPQAVVLTESFNDLLLPHIDGALDASFAWHFDLNGGRILSSPARYAFPQANIFSNGRDLNQLNQVYAAGYNLALSPMWLENADYIRSLIEIRQHYKDALVYGRQEYQPTTGDENAGAYFYRGDQNQVITVVNSGRRDYQGALQLQGEGTVWRDAVTGETFTAVSGELSLAVPAHSLRILVLEPNQ